VNSEIQAAAANASAVFLSIRLLAVSRQANSERFIVKPIPLAALRSSPRWASSVGEE